MGFTNVDDATPETVFAYGSIAVPDLPSREAADPTARTPGARDAAGHPSDRHAGRVHEGLDPAAPDAGVARLADLFRHTDRHHPVIAQLVEFARSRLLGVRPSR
jgi:hypothetical protein